MGPLPALRPYRPELLRQHAAAHASRVRRVTELVRDALPCPEPSDLRERVHSLAACLDGLALNAITGPCFPTKEDLVTLDSFPPIVEAPAASLPSWTRSARCVPLSPPRSRRCRTNRSARAAAAKCSRRPNQT